MLKGADWAAINIMISFKIQNKFSMISEEEHTYLQRPFDEEEIPDNIKLCAKEKAPDPDGSPMIFFFPHFLG